jgi:UDP-glucuronate 4-epimerase
MNLLVTGGAGFIGSHLCERLIASGNSVVCLDNFNDFYSPLVKRNNLSQIINHPKFTLIEGDIRDDISLQQAFHGNNIDTVIHLAAMAGVRPSMEKPELYKDVNVNGTLSLLQNCAKHEITKLIVASSSSVYGNRQGGIFKESDDVSHPISPYAETKKACEELCRKWQPILDIPVLVLRFFTCYGPRQRPDLAIHKFTKLLYEGKPIPFFGDGSTSRDYTYVEDTIDGIIKAIAYNDLQTGFDIFNLGESKTIKLIEMIQELEHASEKKAILDWQPLQVGDVSYTCADISKSKEVLGYNPVWKFPDGIRKFITWFENNNLA